jgi:tetratricopeptide (TPR) repeat protein
MKRNAHTPTLPYSTPFRQSILVEVGTPRFRRSSRIGNTLAFLLCILSFARHSSMRPRCCSLLFVIVLLLVPSSAPAQSTDPEGASLQAALAPIDSLRQAGDFRAARDRLQAVREKHPERVDVLWRLVYTWTDLGQGTDDQDKRTTYYENALDVAKAGLAADSSSARAHLAMAVAQGRAALDAGTRERIRRSRAVKRHAERAIALDSTLDGAYHSRGRWHREVQDIGFFQRAIVKTVYGGLPESSIDQAVRDFQKAIELNDEVFHHLELAKTYLQMDRSEAARRELQTALDMPGTDPFDPKYKEEAQELLDDLD